MGMRHFAWVKLLASVLIWLATAIAAPVWAQSACTAMFGIIDENGATAGAVSTLRYFNTSTNQWISLGTIDAGGNPANGYNALAGSSVTGLLYYVNRTTRQLRSIDVTTVPPTEANIGAALPAPPGAVNINILGATTDNAGNLYVYSTNGGTPVRAHIAQVSTLNAALTIPWTTVSLTTGGTPTLAGSGDIYCDNSNVCSILTNTAIPTRYTVNLTPGANFAQVTSPSVVITGADNFGVAGVAIDPSSQVTYFGGSSTFSLNGLVANNVGGSAVFGAVDMGNCVAPPARPAVNKTFASAYSAASPGTTTVVITLGNANSTPLYLFSDFRDELPAGMVVANPTGLSSNCSSALGTPTTSVGATSITFAAGGRIPQSPGCSITFNVSATASLTTYTNTIPASSLTTSAGTNTAAVTATYKVGTDFSATKFQCVGICGTPVTTTVSLGSGQTMQYVLTVVNSSVGGTGSATFTDTLPAALTPVLSITAGATGGGTCTTATAVVGGATQISGTFANAPAGAQCRITVTALVSAQATANTVTNTLTIATTAGTSDTNAANNTAAVLTNLGPATLLTITKTNNTSTVAAGSTTSYTITVANFGPANAPNSIIKDPAATGLSCTAATCALTAGTATCPAGTPAALMTALQSAGGASIPQFNAGATLTFVVTCGVTATGQ